MVEFNFVISDAKVRLRVYTRDFSGKVPKVFPIKHFIFSTYSAEKANKKVSSPRVPSPKSKAVFDLGLGTFETWDLHERHAVYFVQRRLTDENFFDRRFS